MTEGRGSQRQVNIAQGSFFVTDDADTVLVTILGSCVAACLRDPVAQVGGMNHFLLPLTDTGTDDARADGYGVHLMEILVNGLLARGARRERLQAKLFGGAKMIRELPDIGSRNADFAARFIAGEGIAHVGGSTHGDVGRRIHYWPVSGQARQRRMDGNETVPVPAKKIAPVDIGSGEVELF